jgi:hypothetical protein
MTQMTGSRRTLAPSLRGFRTHILPYYTAGNTHLFKEKRPAGREEVVRQVRNAENAQRNGNGKSKGMHHREHREGKGLREGKGRRQEMIQGGAKPVAGLFLQPESSVLSVFSVVKAVAVSFSLPFSLRSLRSRR